MSKFFWQLTELLTLLPLILSKQGFTLFTCKKTDPGFADPKRLIIQKTQDSAENPENGHQQNKYPNMISKSIWLFRFSLITVLSLSSVGIFALASTETQEPKIINDFSNNENYLLKAEFGPITYPFGVGGPDINDNALVSNQIFFDVTEYNDENEVLINVFDKNSLKVGEKITHIVMPGETLSIIAEKYGINVDTLRYNNQILGEKKYLYAGEELIIPWTDGIFYKVLKGDNLSEIAKKYSINIEDIKKNNPGSETLTVGEEIFLPGAKPKTSLVVTAKKAIFNDTKQVSENESSIGDISGFTSWKQGQDIGFGFTSPVTGIITQGYGNTTFAKRSGFYVKNGDQHRGVDIGADRHTPIYAAGSGEVTFSGWMNGYGNVVFIKHENGFETRYGHNTKNLVKKGDKVNSGEQIGTIGSTGRSTGPHLHFEIRNSKGADFMDFYNNYRES